MLVKLFGHVQTPELTCINRLIVFSTRVRGCQGDNGELALARRAKVHDAPITAFDISASGAFLGTGSSEGVPPCHKILVSVLSRVQGLGFEAVPQARWHCSQQSAWRRWRACSAAHMAFAVLVQAVRLEIWPAGEVALFSAERLAPLARARAAHMVFATAVAFAADETALLSVSADASARATPLPRAAGLAQTLLRVLALLLLLLACALGLGFMARARGLVRLPGYARGGGHTEL